MKLQIRRFQESPNKEAGVALNPGLLKDEYAETDRIVNERFCSISILEKSHKQSFMICHY
jgi:hypothetical protein